MVWFWRDQQEPMSGHDTFAHESTLALGGQSLVLLSEVDPAMLAYIDTASVDQANIAKCYAVGPLKDTVDAKHTQARANLL